MKKNLLICFLICLIVIVSKIYTENEKSENGTPLSENRTQVATQDYLDAYNLFLKANLTDKGEDTYNKAIDALKKVSQTTESPEVKLNCLFLISFSYFLDGNTDNAYKTCLETLPLTKVVFKDNINISLLEKVKAAIENKEITKTSEISSLLNLGEEATELMTDLYKLQEKREEYQELVKKCWEKYKPEFNKKVSNFAKENNFSAEETERIKKQLEENYSKKGYFLPGELEESLAKLILNNLF